jgi:hypothetical protein
MQLWPVDIPTVAALDRAVARRVRDMESLGRCVLGTRWYEHWVLGRIWKRERWSYGFRH